MTEARSRHDANRPMVSVVIPTRDRRDILERWLEALAAQSHPSFEVVVVDDCSSDGTPEFLRQFADSHPDLALRWLRNDTNLGANRGGKRGIRAARGEVAAFTHSDCIAEPDLVERLACRFFRTRVLPR